MSRKRVLITGAAGYLSRQLLPVFRERYDLVLLDRHKPDDIDDIIEVDFTNPDIDSYREHFKGVDAIVHNTRSVRPGGAYIFLRRIDCRDNRAHPRQRLGY